jgi:DNA replication and repair protein RecF
VISESRLEQYKNEEVAAKATLVGPHRDDFTIVIRDKSLASYGSRGEQRLAVLWMKLAELSYIEERSRKAGSGSARPILLLDDIFSELDENHRELVVELIGQQQTIVTSADEDTVKIIGKNAQVIRLKKNS